MNREEDPGVASERPIIEIQGLHKALGGRPVLKGVDLLVPEGKTVVVLGISGSGKSTVLKHIVGLLRPDAGRVLVDGSDVAEATMKELEGIRWRCGVVFQNAALLQSLNVEENIALPLIERRVMPRNAALERAREKLALVGLAGAGEKMPAELSGGMRKRAGIARAIVHDPEIILYDEPTTGLDPIIGRHINDLVVKMRETLGVTSFVISHNVEGSGRIGDVLALLHDGRIVEQGSPEELTSSSNPTVRQFLEGRSEGPIKVL